MRFYTHQHRYTCGIDLHARSLYVCILDDTGQMLVHKNIKASPEALLKLIDQYQDDLIIGVECMFSWYWVADFCEDHGIEFVLGHALYMKAIHGGKAKNDRIDSEKIARQYGESALCQTSQIPALCFSGFECATKYRSRSRANRVLRWPVVQTRVVPQAYRQIDGSQDDNSIAIGAWDWRHPVAGYPL